MKIINENNSTNLNEIKSLENKYNIQLDINYIKFLLKYNGGVLENNEKNNIYIKEISNHITIDVLFGIGLNNNADIEKWTDKYKDEMFPNSIIIGDSITNGLIVIVYSENRNGVYYWDDEYFYEQSNDKNNVYLIAENFNDFINLIS